MKRLIIIALLALSLIVPSIAGAFDLQLVPYADIRIGQLKIENEMNPIARWGLRFEGKDFMPKGFLPNLEFYVSLEGGRVDTLRSAPTEPDVLYERCKHGCTWPDAFFTEWSEGTDYIAAFAGVQYRFNLLGK